MGRDGDGDGAVEEQGWSLSHLWAGGCFLGKFWNCCTFYIIPFPVLCSMFHVTSTLLIFACSFDFFFLN